MDKNEHIDYWIRTADEDLVAADAMFIAGKYNWCLFIGHLVLEKTLKAHFVLANNDVPPKTHDLVRLSKKLIWNLQKNKLIFWKELIVSIWKPDIRKKNFPFTSNVQKNIQN